MFAQKPVLALRFFCVIDCAWPPPLGYTTSMLKKADIFDQLCSSLMSPMKQRASNRALALLRLATFYEVYSK